MKAEVCETRPVVLDDFIATRFSPAPWCLFQFTIADISAFKRLKSERELQTDGELVQPTALLRGVWTYNTFQVS
jgi:hypothetical protein